MSAPIEEGPDDGAQRSVSMLAELSNEMVRLYKEQFGRGPVSERAAWAGPDLLTVVLEGTLTPAERNLVRMGEHERLRETRMFFQYATVREFCERPRHWLRASQGGFAPLGWVQPPLRRASPADSAARSRGSPLRLKERQQSRDAVERAEMRRLRFSPSRRRSG